MIEYEVIVMCDECSETHSIKNITLTDGPEAKASVESFYAGQSLPPELATINTNYISCAKSGKWFLQKNNERVFLVPLRTVDDALENARLGQDADVDASGLGDTGVRETGDMLGASSTLKGAGGQMEHGGGVGTAPTTVKSPESND
ncbi:MAG: hypothetical protein ABR577_01785 [Pyrinomonadaceae bacterium]